MPSRGISGSYGGFISSFFRNLHSVPHSYISLHSLQLCKKFPFFPHPHRIYCLQIFFMKAILTGVRWYLILHVQFTGIKDMNIIVQLSPPSIFRTFSFTQILCPLNSMSLILPSFPWQHHYTLCSYQFDSFRSLIHVHSYNIWPPGSGLFHLG